MSDTPNICLHCNLCCDGTLFNHANIKENEQIATGYSFEILLNIFIMNKILSKTFRNSPEKKSTE